MVSDNHDPFSDAHRSSLKILDKLKGKELRQMREKLLLEQIPECILEADEVEALSTLALSRFVNILQIQRGFCLTADGTDLKIAGSYPTDPIGDDRKTTGPINQELVTALNKGPVILRKSDPLFEKVRFLPHMEETPRKIALFPFQTLYIPLGIFIFIETEKKRDAFTEQIEVLKLLTGLLAEKFEKIGLATELKNLNIQFEREVERRSGDIKEKYEKLRLEKGAAELQPTKKRAGPKTATRVDYSTEGFLKSVGVEIRTPLNGILGFAELLRENVTDNITKEKYIDIIKSCGKSLMKIVDDARTYAGIKSGQIDRNDSEFLLAPFMTELYDLYKEDELYRQREKVEIKINININGSTRIFTDKDKLILILTNLISNAIKFTGEGTIEIGCSIQEQTRRGRDKNGIQGILFFVRDTGVGIEKENQPFVFDEFYKVEHEISQLYGGLGLGLTIAKAMVEMLGGKLQFKSEKGKGTEFWFLVPEVIQLSETEKRLLNGIEPEYDWRRKRILVVEDDAMSVVFLKEALKSSGAQITITTRGTEAVELISKGKRYDLILMDIKLPGMSGYEATRKIKALSDVPVLAQTAYAMSDDYKKILQAGCDDYISKPIHRRTLLQKIELLFNRTEQKVEG
jgi:signal transduction histidine kinase/ActR/RegA family two-component response regulator